MKLEKMRELDPAALEAQAAETGEQMFRLRFQLGLGQTDGLKKLRELKKQRAQLLTVMNEKKRSAK
jgi:large subunit ribosomal protein L29